MSSPADAAAAELPLEVQALAQTQDRLHETTLACSSLLSLLEELEESIQLAPGLKTRMQEISQVLYGGLASGQRVELTTCGTGRVWPVGVHRRSGTILKYGQTEYSFLVELDEPLGEDRVVNAPAHSLRPLES